MQKLNADTIEGFVKTLLLSKFDDAADIPDCHRDWWADCCSDHKFVAIAAPRGHAKSTAITHSYTLAKIVFRESRFVVVVSDTEAQSILFLGDIKKEVVENEPLRELFGIDGLEKDAETDVIIRFLDGHLVRVVAKGSEQKMRGLKWRNLRPDLIICDDIENDELVMNKERREKFQRWFSSALLPVRSDKGIVRMVGTILHADSLLESFMPKYNDPNTVRTPLKDYNRHPKYWLASKFRAHNPDFSQILWASKKTKESLLAIRAQYEARGLLDAYSQEYLNHPIDESNTHFRRSDFLRVTDEDRKKRLNYYVTMDLAVTSKQTADYSVFMVWGVDPDGYIHIRNVIRARMDSLEIIDTIFELFAIYDPTMFVTEKGLISNSIMPAIIKRQDEENKYFRFELLPSMVDKLQRSQAIRLRARAGKVKIDKEADWYTTLEDELMMFPRSAKDDQVDAFALIGHTLNKFWEAPSEMEIAEEFEEEEFRASGLAFAGRSIYTGY